MMAMVLTFVRTIFEHVHQDDYDVEKPAQIFIKVHGELERKWTKNHAKGSIGYSL